jgi:hypothetical protein
MTFDHDDIYFMMIRMVFDWIESRAACYFVACFMPYPSA